MGSRLNPLRVVFDTNTVVSALLFSRGRLAWLRPVWQQGDVVPLMSKATTRELVKVLTYPKLRLSTAKREELLGDFLPFVEIVEVSVWIDDLPVCRDEHNQKFLQLAGWQRPISSFRAMPISSVSPSNLRYRFSRRPFLSPIDLVKR